MKPDCPDGEDEINCPSKNWNEIKAKRHSGNILFFLNEYVRGYFFYNKNTAIIL